jgi:hypothetical protein
MHNINHQPSDTFLRKVKARTALAPPENTRDLPYFPAFLSGYEIRRKNQTIDGKLLDSPENREHNAQR